MPQNEDDNPGAMSTEESPCPSPGPQASPMRSSATLSPASSSAFGVIKKTCESCARAKIKCSGTAPCERCIKRHTECIYVAEQKRGRRTLSSHGAAASADSFEFATTSPFFGDKRLQQYTGQQGGAEVKAVGISVFERRMIRVVFSLYKFHRDDRDLDWFITQFEEIGKLLERKLGGVQSSEFNEFLRRNGLLSRLPAANTNSSSTIPLPSLINLPRFPCAATHNPDLFYLGTIAVEGSKVQCNEDIANSLGYLPNGSNFPFPGISFPTMEDGKTIFPWGGDALCGILADDSDVLSYMRDVAFSFARERTIAQRQFGLYSQVCLLDRRMTLVPAAKHNNGIAQPIECLVCCQVMQNESTGANSAKFDIFLHPRNNSSTTRQVFLVQPLALPDLELMPWPTSDYDALPCANLMQWASTPK